MNIEGKNMCVQSKEDFPNYYNVPNMDLAASKKNKCPVTENIPVRTI